jgi:hypothetical protein
MIKMLPFHYGENSSQIFAVYYHLTDLPHNKEEAPKSSMAGWWCGGDYCSSSKRHSKLKFLNALNAQFERKLSR